MASNHHPSGKRRIALPKVLPTRGAALLRAAQAITKATGRGCGMWRLVHYGSLVFPNWMQCPVVGPDAKAFYLDMRCGGFGHLASGWDLPEIEPVIADLPDDAVAIDIGANVGIWSRLLARKCSVGHVYAFEPSSSTFSILTKNCSIYENVTCIQSAVGSVDGEVPFVGDSVPSALRRITPGGDEGAETVPCVRLASWISSSGISRIDFVKVDVEGFEEDVLCSCLELLAEKGATIVFEFIPEFARARSMHGGRRLFSDLASCNYVVQRIDKDGLRYLDHDGPQDWTNNYIAIPRRQKKFGPV